RILVVNTIPIRNRSAAMFERMRQSTPEQRLALSAAAHAAVRGSIMSDEAKRRMALAKGRMRGEGEFILAAAFRALGHTVLEQHPVDFYNIDLLIGNVAVEPSC